MFSQGFKDDCERDEKSMMNSISDVDSVNKIKYLFRQKNISAKRLPIFEKIALLVKNEMDFKPKSV